jgi:hypothetical protein
MALVIGETGAAEVGDGVQLVSPAGRFAFSDVDLVANDRVGLLVDLGGRTLGWAALDDVTADGTGDQLGVVVQSGTVDASWDDGVTRLGATAANDAALLESSRVLPSFGGLDLPALELDGLFPGPSPR